MMSGQDLELHNELCDRGWYAFSSPGRDHILPNFAVNVVEVVDGHDSSGGEAPQGWEGVAWIIFEVQGRYFKKFGTVDSYYSVRWDGKFVEVLPKKKVVTVYE